jgi:Mg-chelatase subunit ChlD
MTDTQTAVAPEQKLSEYDFIIAIDASGSMGETDTPNGKSRWDYVQETATAFARDLTALDSDGIGVVLFSGTNVQSFDGVTADKIKEIFATRSPRGSTPLAEALTESLNLAGKSAKKDFILVFTDGVPDDQEKAKQVILQAANQQETDDALTILFVQVGRDPAATAYLKQLDDNLKGAKFDIVDAKTIDEAEAFPTTAALVAAAIED